MATDVELLTLVNTAIETVLSGGAVQSYSVNGRSLSKYSLTDLMSLKEILEKKVSASKSATTQVRF